MRHLVLHGSTLGCSHGSVTSPLAVLPSRFARSTEGAVATVADHAPMQNIAPFGLCNSLANPSVASATAAAQGALTPQPCAPQTPSPWTQPRASVDLDGVDALHTDASCLCQWGGRIEVKSAPPSPSLS